MSRNRDIASFLGKTEAENTTNISLGAGGGKKYFIYKSDGTITF